MTGAVSVVPENRAVRPRAVAAAVSRVTTTLPPEVLVLSAALKTGPDVTGAAPGMPDDSDEPITAGAVPVRIGSVDRSGAVNVK